MPFSRLRPRVRHKIDEARDAGLTIVELVVAMSIFTIVLSIYFSALISMSHTTVRAQNGVDASDSLRATFNTLDHQVRYATSINRPVRGSLGGSLAAWYVELEATNLPNGEKSMCYQWRLDPATNVLSMRTLKEDGVSSVTAWHLVSRNVKTGNVVGGVPASPFEFTPASTLVLRQKLTVHLVVDGPGTSKLADQATTFIARNSSSNSSISPNNSFVDANGDGVNDLAVCKAGMDHP